MFDKLVFSKYSDSDLPIEQWERIQGVCKNIQLVSPEDTEKELSDAEGLFLKLGMSADKNLIDQAPNLRVIGMMGTGYGKIDTEYARSKNIAVFNIADYATDAVAEFVFGALIGHMRELPRSLENVDKGDYTEADFTGTELRGKTLGILGLGDIGTKVAQIATQGFGMRVLYWSRNRKAEHENDSIEFADINDVLTKSDIVSLHLALTPETEGILSPEKLALLSKNTILINTAPMELLDLEATKSLLNDKAITLILDHSDEMNPEDVKQLNQLPNCIVYPPIAYTTNEATFKKQSIFADNIVAASEDRPLPNLVN